MKYVSRIKGSSLATHSLDEFMDRRPSEHLGFLHGMDKVYYNRKRQKIGTEAFVMHWFTDPVEKVVKDVVINPASDFGHSRLSIRYNWGRHRPDFIVPVWRYDRFYTARKQKKMMNMTFLQRLGWEMQNG